MAWRPYENLINGELDNRTPGRVSGWMRFFRTGRQSLKVNFDLIGDFHEDIRGKVIRLSNPNPSDRSTELGRGKTYMDGFGSMHRGEVGDITAGFPLGPWTEDRSQKILAQHDLLWEENGVPLQEREQRRRKIAEVHRLHIERQGLFYPYVDYPYIEWYSESNGRVVLELAPEQVEIIDGEIEIREKPARVMLSEAKQRSKAMTSFLSNVAKGFFAGSRPEDRTAEPEKVNQ